MNHKISIGLLNFRISEAKNNINKNKLYNRTETADLKLVASE